MLQEGILVFRFLWNTNYEFIQKLGKFRNTKKKCEMEDLVQAVRLRHCRILQSMTKEYT